MNDIIELFLHFAKLSIASTTSTLPPRYIIVNSAGGKRLECGWEASGLLNDSV